VYKLWLLLEQLHIQRKMFGEHSSLRPPVSDPSTAEGFKFKFLLPSTHTEGSLSTPITVTHVAPELSTEYREGMALVSPRSRHLKTVIEKLSKGLEGSLVDTALRDEMLREIPSQVDGPSNSAIKG